MDSISREPRRSISGLTVVVFVYLGIFLAWLGVVGTLIYVAWHFIAKYW